MDPSLIIADEVTSNLDSTTKQIIMSILLERNRRDNMAILFISHDLSLVKQWCRKIMIMSEGKIVETLVKDMIEKNEVHHPVTKKLLSSMMEIS